MARKSEEGKKSPRGRRRKRGQGMWKAVCDENDGSSSE